MKTTAPFPFSVSQGLKFAVFLNFYHLDNTDSFMMQTKKIGNANFSGVGPNGISNGENIALLTRGIRRS